MCHFLNTLRRQHSFLTSPTPCIRFDAAHFLHSFRRRPLLACFLSVHFLHRRRPLFDTVHFSIPSTFRHRPLFDLVHFSTPSTFYADRAELFWRAPSAGFWRVNLLRTASSPASLPTSISPAILYTHEGNMNTSTYNI